MVADNIVRQRPRALTREITLNGVPMQVFFWYYPALVASDSDPGCSAEIELESVWVDEFDCINLFGEQTLQKIEDELWKMLDEGGGD